MTVCNWCGHDSEIPIGGLSVDVVEGYIILKCPDCGAQFARVQYGLAWKPDYPIICCGKRRM